jgi:hypothetical protein
LHGPPLADSDENDEADSDREPRLNIFDSLSIRGRLPIVLLNICSAMAGHFRFLPTDSTEEIQNNTTRMYNNESRLELRVGERMWANHPMVSHSAGGLGSLRGCLSLHIFDGNHTSCLIGLWLMSTFCSDIE